MVIQDNAPLQMHWNLLARNKGAFLNASSVRAVLNRFESWSESGMLELPLESAASFSRFLLVPMPFVPVLPLVFIDIFWFKVSWLSLVCPGGWWEVVSLNLSFVWTNKGDVHRLLEWKNCVYRCRWNWNRVKWHNYVRYRKVLEWKLHHAMYDLEHDSKGILPWSIRDSSIEYIS